MRALTFLLLLCAQTLSVFGVTNEPSSFPTSDEPSSFPTSGQPTSSNPTEKPDDVVTTCVDVFLGIQFANGNPTIFAQNVVDVLESTIDSSLTTQIAAIVDNDDASVDVNTETQEQNIYDGDKVGVDSKSCIKVNGSPEVRRRLIEIELPSVAEIVAVVEETFNTPEKLETFTEELQEAAEEQGVDTFDETVVAESEVTKIPPSNPTAAPTPSTPCLDSTRDFLVNEELQNCAWVAKEPAVRCEKGGRSVATHCQATCGECGTCNDAKKQFMTKTKGLHTCEWVGFKGNGQRCKTVGDPYTCRKTCGTCNNGSPCLDSTQRFLVNEIPRTCAWVAGNPEVKCLRGFTSNHCPVTCGTCDEGCVDSGARFFVDGLSRYKTCKWVGALDDPGTAAYRCGLIGKDNGLSTCPEKCGFC